MVNNSVCFSGKKEVCTAPKPVLLQTHQTEVLFSQWILLNKISKFPESSGERQHDHMTTSKTPEYIFRSKCTDMMQRQRLRRIKGKERRREVEQDSFRNQPAILPPYCLNSNSNQGNSLRELKLAEGHLRF